MGGTAVPILWGQAAGPNPAAGLLAELAARRWFSSLTLWSPGLEPSVVGLRWGAVGLASLLFAAMILQGPVRALGQFFDLPGLVRLGASAAGRLRRSSRLVVVAIGATVLAWTGSQAVSYRRMQGAEEQGKADLLLLTRSRSLGELAFEGGSLAALTPLRDVAGLGDNLPLLLAATLLLFQATSRRAGREVTPGEPPPASGQGKAAILCASAALYALYRLASMALGTGGFPAGGYLLPASEAVAVTLLMLASDGLLLGWILSELRNARPGGGGDAPFDALQAAALMPAAALACAAALPSRYAATAALLGLVTTQGATGPGAVASYVRWQLGDGLAILQAASLVTAGLAGAVAWSGGSPAAAVAGYARLLRAEGGRLAAALAAACLASGLLSAAAYAIVLALPAQGWVLAAADSYAHYATLPVGLMALAAAVELGERGAPAGTKNIEIF